MKHVLFSFLLLTITFFSCKNDEVPAPPAPVQYMSLTAGSTWNYELTNNLPAPTTSSFTLTATDRDSVINGKSYRILTNSAGSLNEYSNITGNDYYNFMNLPEALGGAGVEFLYLKDNVAVGLSWTQTFPATVSGISFSAKLTNTITEKGITKTVKSITYNDVIHVTTTISIEIAGFPLPPGAITTDVHSYYAPKVGLIQSANKIDLDFSGMTQHTDQETNLVSADIK